MEKPSFEFLSKEIRDIISGLGFERETPVQTVAIPAILSGENVLIISPTGSGKTEAALLPVFEKIKKDPGSFGTKALYITPLRALNRDMLKRISHWAKLLGLTVEIRHGDTPQSERRRQALHPPDILITTPETLQVLLVGSRLRTNLKSLRYLVVDEIHQLANDRRGSQLSFGLERLEKLVGTGFQRIGLSATVGNPDEVARFLCGEKRSFRIVDTSQIRKIAEYAVEMPIPTKEDDLQSRELFVTPNTVARIQRIMDLIEGHDRTLIFVNSRTTAEELGSRLGMLGIKAGVHHGSLPREERERVEQEFKDGTIRAMVSTATLELGIDIGSVDLVIQYMSPRQVNSLIQRVGRSGHTLLRKSEGIILSVSPEDALESISISNEALAKHLEPTLIHESPLDVLSHQVAGLLMEYGEISIDEVIEISHRSFSFKSLTKNSLLSVVTFMEKMGYLTLDNDRITRRRKCREYYFENLSMIRDERRYSVLDMTTQKKVGILGEEFMMLHAKVGVHFIIKGKVWQIESIQEDLVYVTPIVDPSAAIPGWDGEMIPIPETVARGVAIERNRVQSLIEKPIEDSNLTFALNWNAEKSARNEVVDEVRAQAQVSRVPTEKRFVVERFKNFLIIHTSAGDRVNSTMGELFEEILVRMGGLVRHWWSDGYRILIELSTDEYETEQLAEKLFHYDNTLPGFIEGVLRKHFPFGYEMKFIAERFGALKRGRMMSGDEMKELGIKFRFTPIYEETLREAFATKVDIPRTTEILKECEEGKIRVSTVITEKPSPLAMYILSRYAEDEDFSEPAVGTTESMKSHAAKEVMSMLCFDCGFLKEFVRVGDLPEFPACEKCGSKLLSVIFYGARFTANALIKKRSKVQNLTKEENDILSKTRRSADLVLAYGKKGIIAQSVYGVGPQMAARVLSRMHDSDEEFYEDLLEAKLKFIETKKYWD
ncbi:MAG: DEAD/DEAH box helicase [Thaumarchaeota archaeon]|nr:DEAD/DEAH box helicase [Nitrososphaerota archaeon]